MTNSEAIEELRSRKLTMSMCIDIESCRNANNAIDMSIQALEENDKLKTEIEQLKSELEQWQSTNLKLVCELTRIECENNQLKSELEQSDSCDGCKHELERNEYYCDGCKRISVDGFELKSEVSE